MMGCEARYCQMFCNTANVTFGPVFESDEEVEAFIQWHLEFYGQDPRHLENCTNELVNRQGIYRRKRDQMRDANAVLGGQLEPGELDMVVAWRKFLDRFDGKTVALERASDGTWRLFADWVRDSWNHESDGVSLEDAVTELMKEAGPRPDVVPAVVPYRSGGRREATMLVSAGGFRFNVGEVPAGKEDRKVQGGPMVAGPWAYAYGLATAICANPEDGTWGEDKRAKAAGLYLEVADGDRIRLPSGIYRVRYHNSPKRGEWLELDREADDET